jgi:hypothetical protein
MPASEERRLEHSVLEEMNPWVWVGVGALPSGAAGDRLYRGRRRGWRRCAAA